MKANYTYQQVMSLITKRDNLLQSMYQGLIDEVKQIGYTVGFNKGKWYLLKNSETKPIANWEELVGLETETHYLKIDLENCCGWIYSKDTNEEVEYLHTHTFYEKSYEDSKKILNNYGFNVIIEKWDTEENDNEI